MQLLASFLMDLVLSVNAAKSFRRTWLTLIKCNQCQKQLCQQSKTWRKILVSIWKNYVPTWKQTIVNTKEPKWKASIWHKKKRFNGIKDNFVYIIIAQVKERFPEKDMQVLKVFNTIPNLAKLPGTGAEIRNHGTKNLERLLERCWCIWRRKCNWCWWSKKFIYPV